MYFGKIKALQKKKERIKMGKRDFIIKEFIKLNNDYSGK